MKPKKVRLFGGKRYTYNQSFSFPQDMERSRKFYKGRGYNVRIVRGSTYTSPKLAKYVNSLSGVIGDKSKTGSRTRWDMFIRRYE